MQKNSHVIKLFKKFQKIPVGHPINNPNDLIFINIKLSKKHSQIIHSKNNNLFFTRKTLKHIAEKSDANDEFLGLIFETIQNPDEIHKTKNRRFLFSKFFYNNQKKYRPHIVTLEISDQNIIVTSFTGSYNYLRNFEILWRTEILSVVPPSQHDH